MGTGASTGTAARERAASATRIAAACGDSAEGEPVGAAPSKRSSDASAALLRAPAVRPPLPEQPRRKKGQQRKVKAARSNDGGDAQSGRSQRSGSEATDAANGRDDGGGGGGGGSHRGSGGSQGQHSYRSSRSQGGGAVAAERPEGGRRLSESGSNSDAKQPRPSQRPSASRVSAASAAVSPTSDALIALLQDARGPERGGRIAGAADEAVVRTPPQPLLPSEPVGDDFERSPTVHGHSRASSEHRAARHSAASANGNGGAHAPPPLLQQQPQLPLPLQGSVPDGVADQDPVSPSSSSTSSSVSRCSTCGEPFSDYTSESDEDFPLSTSGVGPESASHRRRHGGGRAAVQVEAERSAVAPAAGGGQLQLFSMLGTLRQ